MFWKKPIKDDLNGILLTLNARILQIRSYLNRILTDPQQSEYRYKYVGKNLIFKKQEDFILFPVVSRLENDRLVINEDNLTEFLEHDTAVYDNQRHDFDTFDLYESKIRHCVDQNNYCKALYDFIVNKPLHTGDELNHFLEDCRLAYPKASSKSLFSVIKRLGKMAEERHEAAITMKPVDIC